jgi:hypothetical protein
VQTLRHGDAPLLHETAMMSMPVMQPEATERANRDRWAAADPTTD